MKTLPKKLHDQLIVALTNLRLATLCTEVLFDIEHSPNRSCPTHLSMKAPSRHVSLTGTHCGPFVTPVIHSALLDVRRALEFFRLRWDRETESFAVDTDPPRYHDDFRITDLGLPPVDPSELQVLALRTIGGSPTECLFVARNYADKCLAHFTKTEKEPEFRHIIDSTKLVHEALLVFVFDALHIPRPSLQPSVSWSE